MSIQISVWYYNDLMSEWVLKGTNHYQETKDEYKYFRVMSNCRKHFYSSANDYFIHNKNSILIDKNENENENENENKENFHFFTDIKDNKIYKY